MTTSFVENSSYSDKEKEEVILKIESIQDVINKRFEEFINTEAHISEQPNQTLEKYPNLVAVHHNEYERENPNARFKFGRLDLPELFYYDRYEHTWDEREENAIQKSLKKQTLFSKITLSLLSKIRGAIKKDVTKEKGDEPRER